MKVGLRMPNVKKSVKARTTGRAERAAKSAINPVYGKKMTGLITDPERAVKNKIYHTVTVDPLDKLKHPTDVDIEAPILKESRNKKCGLFILFLFMCFACFGYAYYFDHFYNDFRIMPVLLGGLFLIAGIIVI